MTTFCLEGLKLIEKKRKTNQVSRLHYMLFGCIFGFSPTNTGKWPGHMVEEKGNGKLAY